MTLRGGPIFYPVNRLLSLENLIPNTGAQPAKEMRKLCILSDQGRDLAGKWMAERETT